MRRLFKTTSVVALLGLPAFAGGVAEPVMESNVVVQDTTSSASGIVVPLLLLLLIAAAVAGSDGSSPPVGPSDRRIKADVAWVGMAKGLPIYRYRYIGSATRFEGVMAQDVAAWRPDAVETLSNGIMAVRYDRLGLQLKTLH